MGVEDSQVKVLSVAELLGNHDLALEIKNDDAGAIKGDSVVVLGGLEFIVNNAHNHNSCLLPVAKNVIEQKEYGSTTEIRHNGQRATRSGSLPIFFASQNAVNDRRCIDQLTDALGPLLTAGSLLLPFLSTESHAAVRGRGSPREGGRKCGREGKEKGTTKERVTKQKETPTKILRGISHGMEKCTFYMGSWAGKFVHSCRTQSNTL